MYLSEGKRGICTIYIELTWMSEVKFTLSSRFQLFLTEVSPRRLSVREIRALLSVNLLARSPGKRCVW